MIKCGSIVSPIKSIPCKDGFVTPDIRAFVLNVINGVAMILPWNSGHECITKVSNLKLAEPFGEEDAVS